MGNRLLHHRLREAEALAGIESEYYDYAGLMDSSRDYWISLLRALSAEFPWLYFEHLRDRGALNSVFPELASLCGKAQVADYHPEIDCFVHTMLVLKQITQMTNRIDLRLACLLHDVGKGATPESILPHHYGHELSGHDIIIKMKGRYGMSDAHSTLCRMVARHHTDIHTLDRMTEKTIVDRFIVWQSTVGGFFASDLGICCLADARGRGGMEDRDYRCHRILDIRWSQFMSDYHLESMRDEDASVMRSVAVRGQRQVTRLLYEFPNLTQGVGLATYVPLGGV